MMKRNHFAFPIHSQQNIWLSKSAACLMNSNNMPLFLKNRVKTENKKTSVPFSHGNPRRSNTWASWIAAPCSAPALLPPVPHSASGWGLPAATARCSAADRRCQCNLPALSGQVPSYFYHKKMRKKWLRKEDQMRRSGKRQLKAKNKRCGEKSSMLFGVVFEFNSTQYRIE